ncbi:MAG TPA: response regulator transcription factor [Rhodocyclaceae bacterium]|nr:response regulator transcription factor [Rhodocyclaceae bacterium]
MRILLVEDDVLLGDGIRAGLMLASYAVDWVRDGEMALRALADHDYDACVLDLGLPKKDGLAVLRELRQAKNHTPVIVLTARDTRQDKILGLDSGADHYLTKPFDLGELQAHIRALTRRVSDSTQPLLVHRGVTLDPASKRATINGEVVPLSGREYALLLDFMSHPKHLRSRAQLEESLYAWGDEVESNAVEVYIHHLRKKFGADFIQTVRGLGYQLRSDPS